MNSLRKPFNKTVLIKIGFLACWIPVLYFDSAYSNIDWGVWITFLLTSGLFVFQYKKATLRLRLLMIMIVPLSYAGELISTELLGLYAYRLGTVPIYIPIGHAVVYASAYEIFLESSIRHWVQKRRNAIMGIYALLFLMVLLVFEDTLSAIMGALLFWMLIKKRNHSIYLIIGWVVLYLEVSGTYLGNWAWERDQLAFHTTNPPLGSVMIYVGGDALLNKLLRIVLRIRRKKRRAL
jgi:hypothetical protein